MQGAAPDAGTSDGAARWRAAAAAVLRRMGADVPTDHIADALASVTVEGIPVPVLRGAVPAATIPAPAGWDLRALISDDDPDRATGDLAAELTGGADSVWLTVGGSGLDPSRLPALAAGVDDGIPLILEPDDDLDETALARVLAGRAPGTSLGADPLSRRVRGRPGDREVVETARVAADFGIRAVVVDGTTAHEAGAGDTGELGYTLAVAMHYLRAWTDAGIDLEAACRLLTFRYAVTDEQFLSMAKLRAAQLIWARIRQVCGLPPARQPQHAVTSRLMMTRFDAWTNLLRTTVAGFAAAVAGADAITVLPYDAAAGHPDPTARRLARAVVLVLEHESRLARDDPAGGAGAIETLTDAYADAAWAEFQRLDSAGVDTALADGSLIAGWRATAAERRARIGDGRSRLTGITTFPNRSESPPVRPTLSPLDRISALHPWSREVENSWESV